MRRRIAQIATLQGSYSATILAVCEDGTLWRRDAFNPTAPWEGIPGPSSAHAPVSEASLAEGGKLP